MTEKFIYVVEGSTGEYSDHVEWAVCAYEVELEAQKLAKHLSDLARDATQKLPGDDGYYNYDWGRTDSGKDLLKLDPAARVDYTGLDYTVYPVRFILAESK